MSRRISRVDTANAPGYTLPTSPMQLKRKVDGTTLDAEILRFAQNDKVFLIELKGLCMKNLESTPNPQPSAFSVRRSAFDVRRPQ